MPKFHYVFIGIITLFCFGMSYVSFAALSAKPNVAINSVPATVFHSVLRTVPGKR